MVAEYAAPTRHVCSSAWSSAFPPLLRVPTWLPERRPALRGCAAFDERPCNFAACHAHRARALMRASPVRGDSREVRGGRFRAPPRTSRPESGVVATRPRDARPSGDNRTSRRSIRRRTARRSPQRTRPRRVRCGLAQTRTSRDSACHHDKSGIRRPRRARPARTFRMRPHNRRIDIRKSASLQSCDNVIRVRR